MWIKENELKDLCVAADYGGKDKIADATLLIQELPHIPFHQVDGFYSKDHTNSLLQRPSFERYCASSVIIC